MTTVTVLSGPERRRRWTSVEKLRIVEESVAPGVSVVEVARRHDVHPNQLHLWRKQVRSGDLSIAPGPDVCFAPVEITGTDRVALPSVAARTETAAPLMIEVILRNGRVLRLPERIGARRAGCLADVLEGRGP